MVEIMLFYRDFSISNGVPTSYFDGFEERLKSLFRSNDTRSLEKGMRDLPALVSAIRSEEAKYRFLAEFSEKFGFSFSSILLDLERRSKRIIKSGRIKDSAEAEILRAYLDMIEVNKERSEDRNLAAALLECYKP